MAKVVIGAYIETVVVAHISRGNQRLGNLFGLIDNLHSAFEAVKVGRRIVGFGDIVELSKQFLQFFGRCEGHDML
jgi:hypothetical protein